MTKPIILDGKIYTAVLTPNKKRLCGGCVAESNHALCHALPDCSGANFEGTIFIEVSKPQAPVNTVKQEPIARNLNGVPIVDTKAAFDNGYARGVAAKQAEWTRFEVQRTRANLALHITHPLVRKTDPLTSVKAAESMTLTRKAGRIADLILVELRTVNLTGKQLTERTGVALNSITPRFAQLSRRGLIHAAGGSGRETVWSLGNGVTAAPSVSPSLFESA